MRALPVYGLPLLLLAGCASSPESCRKPIGEIGLTPTVAAEREDAIGQAITWGGTLVGSRNLADSTELEVLAFPLGDCGRPRTGDDPLGRFIIRRPGYLETVELRPGRDVTASGRIIATSEGRIGDADYRFPIIEDANPRIWDEPTASSYSGVRPWISIGVGGGRGWSGGGVGVMF
ncbi:MAG: Slp family lipoprotein [Thiohalocapsa sp.]